MTRFAFALTLFWLLTALFTPTQAAERRIALVIGNSAYAHTTSLPNAMGDAQLLRDTLKKLNFEVVYSENATKADMRKALADFSNRLKSAGPSGVAMFYYAGHGIQSGGENYLLPVDISIQREADLGTAGIRANEILAAMEDAKSATKIIVLDACRNNPFKNTLGAGAPKGLADMSLGNTDFFVSYAATAGNVAYDGDGGHSPYATALARRLETPNMDISNTFRLVRVDVSDATSNRQLPEVRTTMRKLFAFVGKVDDDAPASTSPIAEVRMAMLSPTTRNLVGKWCEATRGRATVLDISPKKLQYVAEGAKISYDVSGIEPQPKGRLEVSWINKSDPMIFEFGEFDPDGNAMTQIRGRRAKDLAWKEYFLRFRRCG